MYPDTNIISAEEANITNEEGIHTIDCVKPTKNDNCYKITTSEELSRSSDTVAQSIQDINPDLSDRKIQNSFERQNQDYVYNINNNFILRSKPLQVVYDKSSSYSRSLKDLTVTSVNVDNCNLRQNEKSNIITKGLVRDSDDEQNENSIHSSSTDVSQKSLTESRLHAGSLTESALARCSENGSSVTGKLKIIQNLITEVVDGIPSTEV